MRIDADQLAFVNEGITDIIDIFNQNTTTLRSRILNVKTKGVQSIRIYTESGIGLIDPAPEASKALPEYEWQTPYNRDYPTIYYAGKTTYKQYMESADVYSRLKGTPKKMSDSFSWTMDNSAASIYTRATTTLITPDGLSLANAAHLREGGATWSNVVTGALSPAVVNSMLTNARTQPDYKGVPFYRGGKFKVITAPILANAWRQYVYSKLIADSNNNNQNYYAEDIVDVIGDPLFNTSTIASALIPADIANSPLRMCVRQGLMLNAGCSNEDQYCYVSGSVGYVVVPADPHGFVWNTGS
jgi:hypothetical protein